MSVKFTTKIRRKIKDISQATHFGLRLTLINMVPGRFLIKGFFIETREKLVLNYLRKNYSYVIEKYKNLKIENSQLQSDCPIFVCWFQGEKAMPPIVKACFASIKEFAQDHPVILITQENFSQYVEIPDHILRKVNEKKITLTHFSDIVRANLLAKYDAIWLDSTVYLTAPLNWPTSTFHTLKRHGFCSCIAFSGFSPAYKDLTECVRWTGFCIRGGKTLFSFVSEAFSEYWKKENNMIGYLLIDYFIELAYENIPEIKAIIDSVPFSNEERDYLSNHIADDFDKTKLSRILKNTSIFKLSHKPADLGLNASDLNSLSKNSIYRKIVDGTFLSDLGR